MGSNEKVSESEMLGRLSPGATLLRPLTITSLQLQSASDRADARLEARLPGDSQSFRFVVECKTRSTPQLIQSAIAQVKAYKRGDESPLIQVPYLAPERLEDLEAAGVSGVDLCGNGIIVVPGRLYLRRTGEENKYPDSRPLMNPYR